MLSVSIIYSFREFQYRFVCKRTIFLGPTKLFRLSQVLLYNNTVNMYYSFSTETSVSATDSYLINGGNAFMHILELRKYWMINYNIIGIIFQNSIA